MKERAKRLVMDETFKLIASSSYGFFLLLIISFANKSNIKSMLDELTSSYKNIINFYLTKRQDQLANKTQKKFVIARSNRWLTFLFSQLLMGPNCVRFCEFQKASQSLTHFKSLLHFVIFLILFSCLLLAFFQSFSHDKQITHKYWARLFISDSCLVEF